MSLLSKSIKKVHFIGIGGVSMSGLAELLIMMGFEITGSDITETKFTQKLTNMGVKIYKPHNAELMGKPDLVVYTSAIHPENCEYKKAYELNIPIINRADLLGEIMKTHKFGIGISGAHGKTTTTTTVSYLFEKCGLNPTIHIGGVAEFIGGTTKKGDDNYFITEACEYTDTFLKLNPYIGIVLNIDYDHVDWFENLEDMQQSFLEFAQLIPKEGFLIVCHDDENSRFLEDKVNCNVIKYGLNNESLDYTAKNITFDDLGRASFDLYIKGKNIKRVKINIPGTHNILNVLPAIASCIICGGNLNNITNALIDMKTPKRRFELTSDTKGIKVFKDYAHNPAEIYGTIEMASKIKHNHIWAVFEPHTYTRLHVLFKDFINSFELADHVIMADIYNDREKTGEEVSSELLANEIANKGKDAIYLPSYESITTHLYKNVKEGDIVLILGSKFIEIVANKLADLYKKNS